MAAVDIDLTPATQLSVGVERQVRSGERTTTLTLGLMAASALGYLGAFVLLPAMAERMGAVVTTLLLPVLGAAGAILYLPLAVAVAVEGARPLLDPHPEPVRPARAGIWLVGPVQ